MALTDPRYVWLAPDTAHLYAGGADVPELFRKHRKRAPVYPEIICGTGST